MYVGHRHCHHPGLFPAGRPVLRLSGEREGHRTGKVLRLAGRIHGDAVPQRSLSAKAGGRYQADESGKAGLCIRHQVPEKMVRELRRGRADHDWPVRGQGVSGHVHDLPGAVGGVRPDRNLLHRGLCARHGGVHYMGRRTVGIFLLGHPAVQARKEGLSPARLVSLLGTSLFVKNLYFKPFFNVSRETFILIYTNFSAE